jgi:Cu/Ag efflux pump CusA
MIASIIRASVRARNLVIAAALVLTAIGVRPSGPRQSTRSQTCPTYR